MILKDGTGLQYGRLTVIKFAYRDWNGAICWICKCDCGNEIIVRGSNLQSENTQSCGCFQREKSKEINRRKTGEKKF